MHKNITTGVALYGLLIAVNATFSMENLQLNVAFRNPETGSEHHTPRSHKELSETISDLANEENYVYERPNDSYFTSPRNNSNDSDFCTLMMSSQSGRVSRKSNDNTTKRNIQKSYSKQKLFRHGYYTNSLDSLPFDLPIYDYRSEQSKNEVSKNASKITCIDTKTNQTKIVRFSGQNNSNETLEYNNEKYHVIIDFNGNSLLAIKMNPTESTESQTSSGSQTPKKPTEEQCLQYNGYYTNELDDFTSNLPSYTLVDGIPISDHADGISYKNKKTDTLETILFHSDMQYKKERYIVIVDDQNKPMFILDNHSDATESKETAQDELQRKKSIETLKKLRATLSNSRSSDSEKQQSTEEDFTKKDSSDKSTKSETTLGSLVCTPYDSMPTTFKQYEGSITKTDLQTAEITYHDENRIPKTVCVNNTPLSSAPTFALIKNSPNEILYVVKLPKQEDSTKSTHNKAFNGKNHAGSSRTTKILGITTFAAFCIALAYHYDKLPDAFAQFLDNLITQCKNLVPSSFSR